MMFLRSERAVQSLSPTPPETAFSSKSIDGPLLRSLKEFDIATVVSAARSLYVLRPQRERDLQHIGMRAVALCHCPPRVFAAPQPALPRHFFRRRYKSIPLHVSRTDITVLTD